MAQFILIRRDKKGALETRLATRQAHLAYVEKAGANVLLAGPMLDDGGNFCASVFILEAESQSDAQRFADEDPYAKAGVFGETEIRPFRIVTGSLAPK